MRKVILASDLDPKDSNSTQRIPIMKKVKGGNSKYRRCLFLYYRITLKWKEPPFHLRVIFPILKQRRILALKRLQQAIELQREGDIVESTTFLESIEDKDR